MIDKIKKWIEFNPATLVGVVLAAAAAVAFLGCSPKVTSQISGENVTRAQFGVEVAREKSVLESRAADLEADVRMLAVEIAATEAEFDHIEGVIANVLGVVEGLVVSAAGPYATAAATGFALITAGLSIDNRRKDGVIKGQKQAVERLNGATVVPQSPGTTA